MSALAMQSFGFGDQLVRAIDREGAAWFVARDVCAALDVGNTAQALSRLDDDEKGVITNDTPGGQQQLSIISESGLYSLTFTSRKEAAKRFKRWVTHEVLPSLRQTGRYEMTDGAGGMPEPAEAMAMRFRTMRSTPDALEEQRMKLRTVEAARMAFGPAGARRAWIMAGLPDLSDERATFNAAGISVIEALHQSMAEWIERRTEPVPGHREETQTLYRDYVSWARSEKYEPHEVLSLSAFGKALSRCGVGTIKTNRMHRLGLKLTG